MRKETLRLRTKAIKRRPSGLDGTPHEVNVRPTVNPIRHSDIRLDPGQVEGYGLEWS